MKKRLLLSIVLCCFAIPSQAAIVFADSATTVNTTSFGSGLLTGNVDSGGHFLAPHSDPPTILGSITAGFSGGIVDGAGDDLIIYDCCAGTTPTPGETASVSVSTDNITFTFLGLYGPVNSFDFNGIFASVVNFVKIVNTSTTNSPDIDAFQGNYMAPVSAVPVPAAVWLFGTALIGLVGFGKRRKAA